MAAAQTMAMTMTQKIIAIAVTIIIISTVALPIIDDTADGVRIIKQNSGEIYSLKSASDNGSYSFSYDANSGYVTVNDYSFKPNNGSTLAFTDSIYVFFQNGMRVYGNDNTAAVGTTSVLFSSGVASWTASGTDYTATYTYAYIPDPNGDWGAFKNGDVIKFNEDTKLIYTGANQPFTNDSLDPSSITVRNLVLYGTYDSFDSLWARSSTDGVTSISLESDLSNIVAKYDDGHLELTVNSAVTVVAHTNLGDYSRNVSLSVVLAPLEYWVYDSEKVSLFGVVATILILVPVMMAARMIALKRN